MSVFQTYNILSVKTKIRLRHMFSFTKRINTNKFIKTACLVSALTMATSALAIRATQQQVVRIQPDGSTVTMMLYGDERAHCATTVDGIPVVENSEGYLVYADYAEDGSLTATEIIANDANSADRQKWFATRKDFNLEATLKARLANGRIKETTPRVETTRGIGLSSTSYPHFGSPKAIIILVEYQDVKFKTENPYEYFNALLNEEGFSQYNATGSVLDWFRDNSKGQFTPEFDLYGPVTLPNEMSYYGKNDRWGNDANPEQMVIHACDILDETVDFSQYDTDGDGKVDNIYVFYAGYGEADGGGSNTVWPHSWDITSAGSKRYRYDGVIIDHYACSNEVDHYTRKPDGIGTFVHEFSHVLGLPDLYQTDGGTGCFTPGSYSVLDYGPYNNDGRTPPNYSSYELYALDWITPIPLDRSDIYELPNLADSHEAYILPTDNTNEYYLFENRQKTGNDKYIPGHGMLVWHIDYKPMKWEYNEVNNTKSHQYVDLVEADNIQSQSSTRGDTFPGSENVTEFTFSSAPSLKSWSGESLKFGLYDISENNDIISFKGLKDGEDLPTTAIDRINDKNISFHLAGNQITAFDPVDLYDLSGLKIMSVMPGESAIIPMKGIYILKSDGKATKIKI